MLSTILLYVSLALSVLSLVLAGFAFQLAMARYRNLRDVRAIALHLSELEDLHEALSASHKRLRSRVGMRELRAKRKNGEDGYDNHPSADFDPEQWKKEQRLKIARGELKPR
jgi:hypothetical protein